MTPREPDWLVALMEVLQAVIYYTWIARACLNHVNSISSLSICLLLCGGTSSYWLLSWVLRQGLYRTV
ncbi:hypothetical protein ACQKWADRAFT_285830 [Trichoderma austrokoningii]